VIARTSARRKSIPRLCALPEVVRLAGEGVGAVRRAATRLPDYSFRSLSGRIIRTGVSDFQYPGKSRARMKPFAA
jgi:hypothetical protein